MPPVIKETQAINVPDKRIRAIAQRIARQAELGFEKVAAHQAAPSKYVLPTKGDSLERILAARFDKLPAEAKKAAAARAMARLSEPAAKRQRRFTDLAKVDLTKATPVEDQADALGLPAALKLSKADFEKVAQEHFGAQVDAAVAEAASSAAVAATTDKLEFRIHKVRCDDETNGFLGSEAGNDEIDLGGTSVDETGGTSKISPFRVGSNFDDNEEKRYSPPRRFTWFNLREGTAYPKSYFVTLVLAEVDMGGLPDFIQKLMDWVKGKVVAALAAAIGGAIGVSGGPIGALIGAAVGYAVGLVFEYFKSVWEDDVFPPVTARVNIPSLTARWTGGKTDGPEQTATFKGHGGTYQVVYDWRMFA